MEMDMQITIAGGCGDFGRSCFFVEGGRHAFIVDAGTSTDGLDRVPDLTAGAGCKSRIPFFVTPFAPGDHTGAIGIFRVSRLCGIRASDEPDIPADERKTREYDDS